MNGGCLFSPKKNIYTVDRGWCRGPGSFSEPTPETHGVSPRLCPPRPSRLPSPRRSQASQPGTLEAGVCTPSPPRSPRGSACVERGPTVPTFLVSQQESQATVLGPGQDLPCRPPGRPAGLPQLPPSPDLPGPRPQELRVGWTAVPWPCHPAGARNLWAGPVRSCGLAFPGPRGPAGSTITPSSHCHRACVHTAGRTVPWRQLNTLGAAWTPVSARLGWGDGATPPRPTSDMRLERMEATQTPAENCPPRGP